MNSKFVAKKLRMQNGRVRFLDLGTVASIVNSVGGASVVGSVWAGW